MPRSFLPFISTIFKSDFDRFGRVPFYSARGAGRLWHPVFMKRLTRGFLILPLKCFIRVILKAAITTLVFSITAAAAMRWMGLPVPSFSEFENYFVRLAELSGILS